MSDELNPSTTPEKSSDEKAASDEHNGKPDEKFKLTQLEWGGFFGDFFVILWVWSDLIACRDFNRLIFLFAALVVAHGVLCIFISKIFNSWRLALVLWVLLCVPAAWIACKNSQPEPKPFLTLSLRIGESSPILLTNDFFFQRSVVNLISSTNGFELFNGRSMGTIVIPMQTEESNEVFNIIAENDSPVKASDFEVVVGVPIDWEIGLDPSAWSRAGQHWIIPGYRLNVTNLQFWLLQNRQSLLPLDSVSFPAITNFSIPKFNNPTNKIGLLEIWVRSTDFESLLSANVLFVRTPTNVFKPFVSGMREETNGVWRISISQKEYEDSQK